MKKIVVLYSAKGLPESFISTLSAKKVNFALEQLGYLVAFVEFSKNFLTDIQKASPKAVFNCMHGVYGEDGCMSGALNAVCIPYTHSGVLASSICFNKLFSYNFFSSNKILMPKTFALRKDDIPAKRDNLPIKYPFIVKPISQGSSVGVRVIENYQQLCDYDFLSRDTALMQEYIKGKEVNIAVLDGRALGVLEVRPLKRPFYDYYSKYTSGATEHIIPPTLDNNVIDELMKCSEKVCYLSHCRSIVRVEFIVDKIGKIFFLEANTNPGMTDLSICPKIAKHYHNMHFIDLVEQVLNTVCVD